MQSWNAIPAIIHHAPVPGRNRRDERDRHQSSCLSSRFCGPLTWLCRHQRSMGIMTRSIGL